jgi:flagellar operon protein
MSNIVTASFFVPSTGAAPAATARDAPRAAALGGSFRDVLAEQLRETAPVRFSAHAQERLASRQVQLDVAEVGKIGRAVDRAADKGARQTLVVSDRYALVVNVPNRVVITALPRDGMKENVVTNIDSTVFVA